VGGGGGQRKVQPLETSTTLVSRVGVGGGGQGKTRPLKTSGYARFQVVWVVVVARGWSNHRKRALMLVFGVMGGGGGQRKVLRPKTSGYTHFQGGAGKRKAPPLKTSSHARFRQVWVVVGARGLFNPRK